MPNKIPSQTCKYIVDNELENMLQQSNIILKERHKGLTLVLAENFTSNNQSLTTTSDDLAEDDIFYDALDNIDSDQLVIESDSSKAKNIDNFTKYKYSTVTIFEEKKIKNLRKNIFYLKQALHNVKVNNKYLCKLLQKNNFDLKVKYKELANEIKHRLNTNHTDWNKTWFSNKKIKNIEKEIFAIGENNKDLFKKNHKNNSKIEKLETNIDQLNKKLKQYLSEYSLPVTSPVLWIEKSDQIAELHKKVNKVTTYHQFYNIRKKIEKIDDKMTKLWNSKKIEKIYEEILPINNEIYFITTFVHADQSITEDIFFFQKFKHGEIELVRQRKSYNSIIEYKANLVLCEEIASNKNNSKQQFTTVKDLLKKHNNLKLKPTITENGLWITSILLPTIALIIGIVHPPVLIVGIIGLVIKTWSSFFYPKTKKVESWWYNKLFKNQDKKEREKREFELVIKNLKSDKLETKLETQFVILKQELANRKYKKVDALINEETLNDNSSNISENLNIENENIKHFDSSIRNIVNCQNQPSISTKINHSNLTL